MYITCMTRVVSVSLKDEIYKLAKEKGLRWSDALEKGIIKLANEPVTEDTLTKFEHTTLRNEVEQLKRANHTMQQHIIKVSERIK